MLQSINRTRALAGVLPLAILLTVFFVVQPALAADPSISKRVRTNDNGEEILVVTVTASTKAIHSLTIMDASASIEDIKVPEGWAAVASDEKIVLHADKPITPGKSASFRITTSNLDGSLSVVFRGAKDTFGAKESF